MCTVFGFWHVANFNDFSLHMKNKLHWWTFNQIYWRYLFRQVDTWVQSFSALILSTSCQLQLSNKEIKNQTDNAYIVSFGITVHRYSESIGQINIVIRKTLNIIRAVLREQCYFWMYICILIHTFTWPW